MKSWRRHAGIISTVNYVYDAGDAGLAGEPLEIRLLSRGVDVESVGSSIPGWAVEFDNVEFSSN